MTLSNHSFIQHQGISSNSVKLKCQLIIYLVTFLLCSFFHLKAAWAILVESLKCLKLFEILQIIYSVNMTDRTNAPHA